MAKIECELYGDFDEILEQLNNAVLEGSVSATLEEFSDFVTPDMQCAVRAYERYSWTGSSRVSLNITLIQSSGRIFLSAVSTGGCQAVFYKVNTIGEENFLSTVEWVADMYSSDDV
ncbi:MAG: DUF6054 family protein [Firmicutes bacterium]|nr:DUF6054 family protein [[Eubacterium] siraeum]MCM1488092.1 DUF6054 family protein [Bacillota bacterium]